jgi:hypothetical protein
VSAHINEDVVRALVDLVGRTGATNLELGYLHDDVPVEQAGWWAYAQYRGARITTADHRSPTGAALALAERLLAGATCRCTRPVTLSDDGAGCRWRLVGDRWEPGCDEPPLKVKGARGDPAAMQQAMTNRAARRRKKGRR